jgi:hypothetical protein
VSQLVADIVRLCPNCEVKDYYGDAYSATVTNIFDVVSSAGDDCVITRQ